MFTAYLRQDLIVSIRPSRAVGLPGYDQKDLLSSFDEWSTGLTGIDQVIGDIFRLLTDLGENYDVGEQHLPLNMKEV